MTLVNVPPTPSAQTQTAYQPHSPPVPVPVATVASDAGFAASAGAKDEIANSSVTSTKTSDETALFTRKTMVKNQPEKAPLLTGKQTTLPKAKGQPPLKVKGYTWRADGSGWECRRLWTNAAGQRKQSYVAHLSRATYGQLRRKHRTPETLHPALLAWIDEREKEKGRES